MFRSVRNVGGYHSILHCLLARIDGLGNRGESVKSIETITQILGRTKAEKGWSLIRPFRGGRIGITVEWDEYQAGNTDSVLLLRNPNRYHCAAYTSMGAVMGNPPRQGMGRLSCRRWDIRIVSTEFDTR